MKKNNIQLLIAAFIPFFSYASDMPQHPMHNEFQQLRLQKTQIKNSLSPINKKIIHTNPAPSNDIETMGCLILAGGQGTRLGYNGPKGCVVLPLKEPKSLFQLFFEKVQKRTAHLPAHKRPPIAIMTSPLNHNATIKYLKGHNWFGVNPNRVSIFPQKMLPIADEHGHVFYEKPNQIALAPNGNGHALFNFYKSKTWQKWKNQGIKVVNVIPVDNPLAEPFDTQMLAIHENNSTELVLKCIKREDPNEKLGVIATEQNKLCIVEYSELTEELRNRKENGTLTYFLGNTGLFSCTMDFVHSIQNVSMPWHLAHKTATKVTLKDDTWTEEKIRVWKFESFIFDLFPHAQSFSIVLSNRGICFAPLKNKTGNDSLETVARALESR